MRSCSTNITTLLVRGRAPTEALSFVQYSARFIRLAKLKKRIRQIIAPPSMTIKDKLSITSVINRKIGPV